MLSNSQKQYQNTNQEKSSKTLSTLYINHQNSNLSKIRILQKNVLYVIGLSLKLANNEILKEYNLLGQYGKILKIVVNKSGYSQNRQNEITYSAYITYSNSKEASIALLSIDNTILDNNLIRASYGTTKYCNFFLKGIECVNRECLYMHEWTKDNDMILREDICNNKLIFYEQQKIASKISEIFDENEKNNIIIKGKRDYEFIKKKNDIFFPTVDTIYDKDIIYDIEKDLYNSLKSNLNNSSIFNYLNSSKNSENNNFGDYNFEEVDDDTMEYVLVREPNKKRKKWRNQISINQKKNKKPKFSLDEFKVRIKQRNEMASSNSNSTLNKTQSTSSQSSISNISNNLSSFIFYPKINNNIYKNPNKSRFNFVNNNINEKQGLNIPRYITDIIYKKFSSFSFFHKINSHNNFEFIINDNDIFSSEVEEKIKNWNIDEDSKRLI